MRFEVLLRLFKEIEYLLHDCLPTAYLLRQQRGDVVALTIDKNTGP